MTMGEARKWRGAVAGVSTALCILFLIGAMALGAGESSQPAQSGAPTLSITETPVRDLLQTLAKHNGVSIVMSDDVTGTVSLQVADQPFESILDAVCELKGLKWKRSDKGIYLLFSDHSAVKKVAPAEHPVAAKVPGRVRKEVVPLSWWHCNDLAYMFDGRTPPRTPGLLTVPEVPPITGLGEFRELKSPQATSALPGTSVLPSVPAYVPWAPGAPAGAAPAGEKLIEQPMQYPAPVGVTPTAPTTGVGVTPGARYGATGVVGGLQSTVPGAAGPLGPFLPEGLQAPPIAYLPLNALIVVGDEEAIKEFRELITMLDVKVRQVKMEVQLVSVTLSTVQGWGLEWSWAGGNTDVKVTNMLGPSGISIGYSRENLLAKLQAAVSSNKARIIQAFTVTALNNFPASIATSSSFPFVTSSGVVQAGITGGTTVTGTQVNYITIPAQFTVVPRINADDTISAYLMPVFTSLGPSVSVPGGGTVPTVSAQAVQSLVRVKNGETFVMGGTLIKSWTKSLVKVPLLSDIPIIGRNLFTRQEVSEQNDEVFFFVTPRIEAAEEPGALTTTAIP